MKIKQNTIQSGHIFRIIHILIVGDSGSGKTNALLNFNKYSPRY